ncbi:XRE family transcriptional regulator [Sorangium sp. So ce590]|uniref:helix-turn-helix domain-containing protein n=1 Tax=Sorangium sp. So ce590 TaxID=3133317 RepID=UPI003F5F75F8
MTAASILPVNNARPSSTVDARGAASERLALDVLECPACKGRAAEISAGFLQRVERGTTSVGVGVLVRLADALAVEPGVLLRRATLPGVTRGRPPRSPRAKRQPSG